MIVTFLIGNGFDLGCGMKTSYIDVYESYTGLNAFSDKSHIQRFKYELQRSKVYQEYKNWSDFEMGMASYAKQFKSEDEFVDCVRDFKTCMVNHLLKEEEAVLNKIKKVINKGDGFASEIIKSINGFYKGQSKNVIYQIERKAEKSPYWEFNFITFNYTNVLDNILECLKNYKYYSEIVECVHIHGNLKEDVVLGVDNEKQLSNVGFNLTKKGKRAFVKPLFNEMYDSMRVNQAKKMIESSDIICTYGMSLGQSDKTWIDLIVSWLKEDKEHKLFYYHYTEEVFQRHNQDQIMDIEDEKREAFLNRILDNPEDKELIEDQVHIPVAYDIFEFKQFMNEEV